jgi:Rrf2 family iron-sulfur cluster assembly transcriptional regulator
MLSLSKRVDYALIALAHLAERPGRVAPAREIAEAYDLPLPLLMNILKELHQHGMVRSLRGTKGGYELGIDPAAVSLHELIVMLEGPVQTTECVTVIGEPDDAACSCRVSRLCPVQGPLKALNDRLVRFLRDVKLADIILPGKRVDVPVERVGLL